MTFPKSPAFLHKDLVMATVIVYFVLNPWLSPSQQEHRKNGCAKSLRLPRQYEGVHKNPDSDCYLLKVTTLNFIFIPVVMGMTLTLVSTTFFFFLMFDDCFIGQGAWAIYFFLFACITPHPPAEF